MKTTLISRLSERGQVSVPIAIRQALGLNAGSRIAWTLDADARVATLAPVRAPQNGGARAALGFAARFRKLRRTQDWLWSMNAEAYAAPAGEEA